MQHPKDFATFCGNCGSYDVNIYINLLEEIVFECEKCDLKEIL